MNLPGPLAALLVLTLSYSIAYGETSAPSRPEAANLSAVVGEDSARGDDDSASDDDDSASDDDDSASDDDDSASDDDDDTLTENAPTHSTEETIVSAALPWRVIARSSLEGGENKRPGWHNLNRRDLEHGAGPLADPIHALHLLPGVNSDQAANASFSVRGGGQDEISVELDGIRIRELTHLTGIMSVLDSSLVAGIDLMSSAPPAHLPEGLSSTLQLRYIDKPHDRFDGRVSVDALGLGAHIALTLGKEAKSHIVLGARQSLLAAYLAVAKAAGAVEDTASSANYSEIFARYRYDASPSSRLRITLLHSRDQVLFDDVNLHHAVLGLAADWRHRYSESGRIEATLTHSTNSASEPPSESSYPHSRSWHNREHRTMLRAVLHERVGEAGAFRVGIETAVTSLDIEGQFQDTRSVPTWAHVPQAELDVPALALHSDGAWPELLLSIGSELPKLLGPLSLNLGLRASLLNRSKRPYASPRLGLGVSFPSGTSLHGTIALHHQQRLDPLVVDRDIAPSSILPERAIHASLRVEQWFPIGVLLRADLWFKGYDQLVVWTESTTETNDGSFENTGSGRALGAEAFVAVRRGRIDISAGYALLRSTRQYSSHSNPIDAAGDQRHEVDAQAALLLGKRRRLKLAAEYSFASGWPISTLAPKKQSDGDFFRWQVLGVNDRRIEAQHRIAIQLEGSHPIRKVRIRGTVRVSAMPGGSGFTEDCAPLAPVDGTTLACAPLQFLPIVMPWLGLQVDW